MGDKIELVRTRSSFKPYEETLMSLVSPIEPAFVDEALLDTQWILEMQEGLNQFTRNDVWTLMPRPKGTHVIWAKWVFRNKLNEQGDMVSIKARRVAQGYSQQQGIDYIETFAQVVGLQFICLLISFIINHDIILYHMDVKSAFMNGYIT